MLLAVPVRLDNGSTASLVGEFGLNMMGKLELMCVLDCECACVRRRWAIKEELEL